MHPKVQDDLVFMFIVVLHMKLVCDWGTILRFIHALEGSHMKTHLNERWSDHKLRNDNKL